MEDLILENAELVRTVARDQMGLNVAYDESGVRWLDAYIDGQRRAASDEVKAALPDTLGSFLGECIRRVYGGQWQRDPETGGWSVKINERLSVFPFAKVQKQLANEDGDSVLGLFSAISPLLADDGTDMPGGGAAAPSRKRPWWKPW